MAKTKQELLDEAKALGVEVDAKATVKQVQEAIKAHGEVTAEVAPAETVEPEEPSVAKAGKRSAKSLKEVEAKEAKEERKASGEEVQAKPKAPVKPARSRLERRGKHFRKNAELIEDKVYSVKEAVDLAKKTSHVKFDATVEAHINLEVDPRHADQNIRDNLVLPAGTGKSVKVAVADDELLAQLDKGVIDFDVLVATPDFMPKLGKYARVLGPKGLMPNPKSGTVTTDVEKAKTDAQGGKVEYRVDSTGIVHLGIGKVSFSVDQLTSNMDAVMASIKANKPSSVKGNYIKAIYLTTSMGPSVKVDLATVA